jgi:hypothetical protein
MIVLSDDFKKQVIDALSDQRGNYDGSDTAFAKQYGLNNAVYSRLKKGETERLLSATQWLQVGHALGLTPNQRKWVAARTDVFTTIEQDVEFCQAFAKGRICVDECGIGKTFTAKFLSRNRRNCFYVDASQAKTKQVFIRLLARTIGVDHTGKYTEVKAAIKMGLMAMPTPIVIIDEAGDLDYPAFLELKELWNATEGACGWYLMGADGLRAKIDRGINSKKVGYRELFSRYSDSYTSVVPTGKQDRQLFYRSLITAVLEQNMKDKRRLAEVVNRCLVQDSAGNIGGLRRAESILILTTQVEAA